MSINTSHDKIHNPSCLFDWILSNFFELFETLYESQSSASGKYLHLMNESSDVCHI